MYCSLLLICLVLPAQAEATQSADALSGRSSAEKGAEGAAENSAAVAKEALIDETGVSVHQPDLHECRARIARIRGDEVAAGAEIERARRVYSEMGATLQVARLISEWDR